MLKGTRDGLLKRVQPVSIHGQVTWDVFFTDVDDPDGQITVARIGPKPASHRGEDRRRHPENRLPGRRGGLPGPEPFDVVTAGFHPGRPVTHP